MTHEEFKEQALQDLETRAAYDALAFEFNLLHEMLAARKGAGLSQTELAARMGTPVSTVIRAESLGNGTHSPSLAILRKYAQALGCKLEIHLVPEES